MKPFHFPFYPDRWRKGTRTMTLTEKGAYWELLQFQFEQGEIPHNDIEKCRRICGADKDFDLTDVLRKFPDGKDETMVEIKNKVLEKTEQAKKAINTRYGRDTGVYTSEHSDEHQNHLLSKAKVKDKSKDKDKSTNKDKYKEEETPGAVAPADYKPSNAQGVFMHAWMQMYYSFIGELYKDEKKDYVIVAKLLKRFGHQKVVEKANLLFDIVASGKDRFFTRDKLTIGILSSCWNSIIVKKDANQMFYEEIQLQKKEEARNAA